MRQDHLSDRAFADYDELFRRDKGGVEQAHADRMMTITATGWLRTIEMETV